MIDLSTGKSFSRRDACKGLAAIIAAGCAPSIVLAAGRSAGSIGGLRRGLGARVGMMGDNLPYDYRLQYLVGLGGFFETDVNAADNVGVMCEHATFPNREPQNSIFGVFGSNNRYGLFSQVGGGLSFAWWNVGLGELEVVANDSTVQLNYQNCRFATIDSARWNITSQYNDSNTHIRLFAAKRMDNGENIFPPSTGCSMGDVYISRGANIVRHYIPCVSKGNVEYYDEYTKTYCQRVGTFGEGPRK